MVGCAAPNCSNSSRSGLFKFYRFPSDPIRRKKWLINSRRANWTPTIGNYLCNVHFEESQFEQHRMDNKKKLKPNAVPTLFSVPNPPKRLDDERVNVNNRICGNKNIAEGSVEDECEVMSQEDIPVIIDRLKKDIASLQKENKILKKEVEKINAILHQFLSEEQINNLCIKKVRNWSEEGIIKGLKLPFALGKKLTLTEFSDAAAACKDFSCHNNHCISKDLLCDGINHCGDNSDETSHACVVAAINGNTEVSNRNATTKCDNTTSNKQILDIKVMEEEHDMRMKILKVQLNVEETKLKLYEKMLNNMENNKTVTIQLQ